MAFKKLFYYINAETGKFTNSLGAEIDSASKPQLFLDEKVILCLTFLKNDGTAYIFDVAETFELAVDTDFDETTSLMVFSDETAVNVSGDWSEADKTAGKISIRALCNTEEFDSKVGTSSSLATYIEIKKFVLGDESVILQDNCTCRNLINDESPAPVSSDPTYRTAAAQDSIDNTKADKVSGATSGNLAELDSNGNLVDSGIGAAVQASITDDATTNITLGVAATYRAFKIEYTLDDGTNFKKGIIDVMHDGSSAYVDESGSMSIGTISGISFDADINSGNVRLLVTAASVGSSLKMVHKIINTLIVSV